MSYNWSGQASKQVTPVDYEVEMPGRRKTRRIYHVNLLKKWHTPPNATSLLVILQDPSEKDEEGDLESYLLPVDDQQVVTVVSLTASQ